MGLFLSRSFSRAAHYHFKRIGLEAGPLSQWLCSALAEAELPVVCVEPRHMQAVHPATPGDLHRPSLEPRPFLRAQHALSCFVKHDPHHLIAAA